MGKVPKFSRFFFDGFPNQILVKKINMTEKAGNCFKMSVILSAEYSTKVRILYNLIEFQGPFGPKF